MAPAQPAVAQLDELPVDTRSVKALQLQQLKRSFDLFASNYGSKPDIDSARSARQSSANTGVVETICPTHLYQHGDLFACLLQSRSQVAMQGMALLQSKLK